MKPYRHAWLLALPALAFACQLVDPASDLDEQREASTDAATEKDDASVDSGADVDATTGDGSYCSAFADADICDEFDRDVLVPDGGSSSWVSVGCEQQMGFGYAGYKITPDGAAFVLPLRSADASCGLQSPVFPAARYWTLDFDLVSSFRETTDAADYLTLCQLDFTYDAGVDGALSYQSVRLLAGSDNSARLIQIQQTVGKPEPVEWELQATTPSEPFLSDTAPCAVHLEVDVEAPFAGANYSVCGAQGKEPLNRVSNNVTGASGPGAASLFLGFDDSSGTFQTGSALIYDNVLLQSR